MKATKKQREMFAAQFHFFEKWNGEIHNQDDVNACVKDGTALAEKMLFDPVITQLLASVYIILENEYVNAHPNTDEVNIMEE